MARRLPLLIVCVLVALTGTAWGLSLELDQPRGVSLGDETLLLPIWPTTTAAPRNVRFMWPNATTSVSSNFGWRYHPILGTSRLHAGTDIAASCGEETWAIAAGVVTFAGWDDGYGNHVEIDHGDGFSSLSGHMSEIAVSEGQSVAQGQVIGWVGSTGLSTGCHNHQEIRINGEPVDPLGWLE